MFHRIQREFVLLLLHLLCTGMAYKRELFTEYTGQVLFYIVTHRQFVCHFVSTIVFVVSFVQDHFHSKITYIQEYNYTFNNKTNSSLKGQLAIIFHFSIPCV